MKAKKYANSAWFLAFIFPWIQQKTNPTPRKEIDHAIDLRAEFYKNYMEGK
ncbi:hypothetical protein LDI01_08810 [Lentilactobacillus diolivorans]|jgi:hypothetical protein|uniref:Uncharacterized protein n=2 Tax=Lentilactobacillus diolivorans TaxID=179838 RepID=A0A0R1SBT1_9LACO|nr:hypothetical protein FC85_GL002870 [Lentilactobacillus diolivorans DSM 14421]GEP23288.1 hypothetical protein LDI01_08810 [Lentilactobacillus diolivorans]